MADFSRTSERPEICEVYCPGRIFVARPGMRRGYGLQYTGHRELARLTAPIPRSTEDATLILQDGTLRCRYPLSPLMRVTVVVRSCGLTQQLVRLSPKTRGWQDGVWLLTDATWPGSEPGAFRSVTVMARPPSRHARSEPRCPSAWPGYQSLRWRRKRRMKAATSFCPTLATTMQ